MADKIFVRLKEEFGQYLVLTTPKISLIIKVGGENDPAGFELDKELYARYPEYFEKASKSRKKREEKIETIDLEE